MYQRDEPLTVPERLPYFRVETGGTAYTFRRLTPSAHAREFSPVQGLIVDAANRIQRHVALGEAVMSEDTPEDERVKAAEAIADGQKDYADAMAALEWCWGFVIGSMWHDPVWGLESADIMRDPKRRAEAWPAEAGELDECFGRAVFDELFGDGWSMQQIANVARVLGEAQAGGHGVGEAMPQSVEARAAFF